MPRRSRSRPAISVARSEISSSLVSASRRRRSATTFASAVLSTGTRTSQVLLPVSGRCPAEVHIVVRSFAALECRLASCRGGHGPTTTSAWDSDTSIGRLAVIPPTSKEIERAAAGVWGRMKGTDLGLSVEDTLCLRRGAWGRVQRFPIRGAVAAYGEEEPTKQCCPGPRWPQRHHVRGGLW